MTFSRIAFPGSALAAVLAAACSQNPTYVDGTVVLEVGIPTAEDPNELVAEATAQLILPVRLERAAEAMQRTQLQDELQVDVPYVTLEDLDVSFEWTIKNLSDQDGSARVGLNGGNEWFRYVPLNFITDPEEEQPPPPLAGDIPILIPAQGVVTGVIREDELAEAARDLELITRGATNAYAAVLEYHFDLVEFPEAETMVPVPERAFAQIVLYDIVFRADQHMVLDFTFRVRDSRNLLHERLFDAPAGELTMFAPVDYVPPPPPPEEMQATGL